MTVPGERLVCIVVSHAVEVENLRVDFGAVCAVDGVSFHVDYGDVVALLGPNGAGKTTVVETLLGFRRPDAGLVRLHGLDPVRDHHDVTVRTGALLQRGGVWFPMSPRDALRLTASYYDAPRDPSELIELLNLTHCRSTPWRRLSGGEQQRTVLALALVGRPRVLVLDEPTTAVDPEGRQVIRDIIRAERDRGCAVLLTTHELAEAERLCDRLIIVHHGRTLVQGTLDELAGDEELIIEVSGRVDPHEIAELLGCEVSADGERVVRCRVAANSQRITTLTQFLAERSLSVISLRTRATLEERYLELIADEREAAR